MLRRVFIVLLDMVSDTWGYRPLDCTGGRWRWGVDNGDRFRLGYSSDTVVKFNTASACVLVTEKVTRHLLACGFEGFVLFEKKLLIYKFVLSNTNNLCGKKKYQ